MVGLLRSQLSSSHSKPRFPPLHPDLSVALPFAAGLVLLAAQPVSPAGTFLPCGSFSLCLPRSLLRRPSHSAGHVSASRRSFSPRVFPGPVFPFSGPPVILRRLPLSAVLRRFPAGPAPSFLSSFSSLLSSGPSLFSSGPSSVSPIFSPPGACSFSPGAFLFKPRQSCSLRPDLLYPIMMFHFTIFPPI